VTPQQIVSRNTDLVLAQARRSDPLVDLDFRGLDWADKFIVSQQLKPKAFKETLVAPLACFFGECVRSLCDGEWDTENEPWSLRVPSEIVVYPFARVERLFFEHEDEVSLSDFMSTVIALSRNKET
jgi:hypothetical protein